MSEKSDNAETCNRYLLTHWHTTPRRKMAHALGVAVRTVYNRAMRLGLVGTRREWTPDDDRLVVEQAHRWSWERLARELDRSPGAVEARAGRLAVRVPGDELCAVTCGQLLGRDPETIAAWIRRRELAGRQDSGGTWRVWPAVLRDFVIADPSRIRLTHVGDCAHELVTLLAGEWGVSPQRSGRRGE